MVRKCAGVTSRGTISTPNCRPMKASRRVISMELRIPHSRSGVCASRSWPSPSRISETMYSRSASAVERSGMGRLRSEEFAIDLAGAVEREAGQGADAVHDHVTRQAFGAVAFELEQA